MASSQHTTSRRAVLGALAAIPAAIPAATVPAVAQADTIPDIALRASFNDGQQIAMLHVARAWIDRFRACGGDFGLGWNSDGTCRGIMRGIPEPAYWTPTDEGNERLPPHLWIVEPGHQRGAIKALEGLLTLVPGLLDTVTEIVGYRLAIDAAREA